MFDFYILYHNLFGMSEIKVLLQITITTITTATIIIIIIIMLLLLLLLLLQATLFIPTLDITTKFVIVIWLETFPQKTTVNQKSCNSIRVLQKVLSLASDYFLSNIVLLQTVKVFPFTETHFCNLFPQSWKADK